MFSLPQCFPPVVAAGFVHILVTVCTPPPPPSGHLRIDEDTQADGMCYMRTLVSVCVAFSPTGYTTLSMHKQIVKDCKHATNIWTDSLVCRSLCKDSYTDRMSAVLNHHHPPNTHTCTHTAKNEAITKTQTSSLVLICHRVNTQRRTWAPGVNWFQLSCAHTVRGPSSSRCRQACSVLPSRPA